ncbi:MAG: glycosyltransferase family 2 protein [Bacteroidia bacterium]
MKIGICIVFYDDVKHLERLSKALSELTKVNVQVYFTDNSSSFIHVDAFLKLFPKAIYCRSTDNNGFAGGNNQLAKLAFDEGCELIWILNPDMEPEKECLFHLINCLNSDSSIEAVGPVLLYDEGGKVQFAGAKVDFKTQDKTALFVDIDKVELPKNAFQEVDLINGGSVLIRAERVLAENLFAEEYFMYNDEIDLMRRINQGGNKVCIVFSAVCIHHHDWSNKNALSYYRMYYYMMRNKILYWRKYNQPFSLFKAMIIYSLKFPIIARFCYRTAGFRLLYYYYLGLFHGYLGKKGRAQLFK